MSDLTGYDDNYDNDNDPGEDAKKVTLDRSHLRALEKKAKAADEAEALRREVAFLRAGVDVESKTGALLLRAYDGELTPEAIKAYAAEIPGAVRTPAAQASEEEPKEPATTASDEELGQGAERSGLSAGASADTGQTEVDPYRQAMQNQQKVIAAGGRDTEGLAAAIATIREAGQKGDARVLHNPANPRQHYPSSSR